MPVEGQVRERKPTSRGVRALGCPVCGGPVRLVRARAAQGPARCPHPGCGAALLVRVPYTWDGGVPRLQLELARLERRPAPRRGGTHLSVPESFAASWVLGAVAGLPGAGGLGMVGLAVWSQGQAGGLALALIGLGWWALAWAVAASRLRAAMVHQQSASEAWRLRYLEGPAVGELEVG